MRKYVIALGLVLLTGSAAAQTVEETVAFIVNGFADGRSFKLPTRTMTVKQTAADPLTFAITYEPPGAGMTGATIRQVAQCEFEMDVAGDPDVKLIRYDFNKFVSASADKLGIVSLSFSGSCPVRYDGAACHTEEEVPSDFRTPPERLQSAIDHLKANYCKGRAF